MDLITSLLQQMGCLYYRSWWMCALCVQRIRTTVTSGHAWMEGRVWTCSRATAVNAHATLMAPTAKKILPVSPQYHGSVCLHFAPFFFSLLLSSLFMCAFVVQSEWTVKKLFNKCLIQMGSWTWSAFCICFDDTCMYFPQNCMNVILHCSWCFDETSKQITCLQDSLVVHYSFSGHLLVCRLFLGQLDYALLIFRTAWLCISGFQDILDMHCLFSGHLG